MRYWTHWRRWASSISTCLRRPSACFAPSPSIKPEAKRAVEGQQFVSDARCSWPKLGHDKARDDQEQSQAENDDNEARSPLSCYDIGIARLFGSVCFRSCFARKLPFHTGF